jgi:hypothetical protein
MNKLTRRFKKKRKNKTFKGGSDKEANRPINVEPLKNGVQAVGNVIENVNNTVGDGVGWVKDTASEAVVGTTNFFANKANEIGNSMIDAIANKVQANMPNNIAMSGAIIGFPPMNLKGETWRRRTWPRSPLLTASWFPL